MDVDPLVALRDRQVQRVLNIVAMSQTIPNVPLFRSLMEAEAQLVEGYGIAQSELAKIRNTLQIEAIIRGQDHADKAVDEDRERRGMAPLTQAERLKA